jgi:signal transduction histidine kinase
VVTRQELLTEVWRQPYHASDRTVDVPHRGRSAGGSTGLGLDIVQRAAEASGGRLLLDRAPGGGAMVVVELGAAR